MSFVTRLVVCLAPGGAREPYEEPELRAEKSRIDGKEPLELLGTRFPYSPGTRHSSAAADMSATRSELSRVKFFQLRGCSFSDVFPALHLPLFAALKSSWRLLAVYVTRERGVERR